MKLGRQFCYRVYARDTAGNISSPSAAACMTTAPDADGDNVEDALDNCPNNPNTGQYDNDNDGVGNVCDNCIDDYNPGQEDGDNDGIGDVCDCVGCCI